MNNTLIDRTASRFTALIIGAMQILLMIVIALVVLDLFWLFFKEIFSQLRDIDALPDLQLFVQRKFAGVLLVLLGLEILESLKIFFREHSVRVELILIVAIIAVARHIIQLDFEHMDGFVLVGIGALTIALTGGYFLAKNSSVKGLTGVPPKSDASGPTSS